MSGLRLCWLVLITMSRVPLKSRVKVGPAGHVALGARRVMAMAYSGIAGSYVTVTWVASVWSDRVQIGSGEKSQADAGEARAMRARR